MVNENTGSSSVALPSKRPQDFGISLPTKRGRKSRKTQKPRRDNRKSRYDEDYVEEDERQNAEFAEYYRVQRIVEPEEHVQLLQCLASPLPSSFRVTVTGKYREHIQNVLEKEMAELFRNVPGEHCAHLKPPSRIPWYPEGLAWSVSAPRQMLRRDNVLSPFHKFLVENAENGAISRQEAVSMIPPLLLGVTAGCTVLDMCAAPGSKTAQIVEAFAIKKDGNNVSKLGQPGLVLANDADLKRCWMLTHQLKRYGCPQLMVTNHDAQFFPKIMLFDRILCDVPCSGDGTLRKAPDIWRRWTSQLGMGLHKLQRSILQKGLELLKPGGRLVYSTCSMNPLENEAVVAAALRWYGPERVTLVDVKDHLPELKRRPGMTTWKVRDNSEHSLAKGGKESEDVSGSNDENVQSKEQLPDEANATSKVQASDDDESSCLGKKSAGEKAKGSLRGWYCSFEEVPMRRRRKVCSSMFPPSQEELEGEHIRLERCLRLVPHDQDTGGFFVAVFEKTRTAHTRAERAVEIEKGEKSTEVAANKQKGAAEDADKSDCSIVLKTGPDNCDGQALSTEAARDGDECNAVSSQLSADGVVKEDHKDQISNNADTNADTNADDQSGSAAEKDDVGLDRAENRLNEDAEIGPLEGVNGEDGDAALARNDGVSSGSFGNGKRGNVSRLLTDDALISADSRCSADVKAIAEFFGLDVEDCKTCFMTRGGDGKLVRRVVLVSPMVRDMLRLSVGSVEDESDASAKRGRLRVVHAGVNVFERTSRRDTDCAFRIVSDGARTLRACMGKRVVEVGEKDFGRLVHSGVVQITAISDWNVRRSVDGMASGSALGVCGDDLGAVWKGKHSVTLLLPKAEQKVLQMRTAHVE